MAFRTGITAREGLDNALVAMRHLRNWLSDEAAAMANSSVTYNRIRNIFERIREDRLALTTFTSASGIAQYARDQYNDQTYDVVAEYQSSTALLEAIQDQILADLVAIADAGGWYGVEKLSKVAPAERRSFTPAQTASIRASIDAFVASVV